MEHRHATTAPCLACLTSGGSAEAGVLAAPLPGLDDPEGAYVPKDLPPVVDAHVHLFPPGVFRALWGWFDRYGWPIRYPLLAEQVVEHLSSRGVEHMVALHYAHRPGMARGLNAFVAGIARDNARVTGLATVLPGEQDAPQILREAFEAGLAGVKLHCHVQAFAPDEPRLAELYEVCVEYDRPMVIHAGREPKSPAYPVDTYAVCAASRVESVLSDFPGLKLCVPHLGADEFVEYARLMECFEGLWLDTTMMLADYFPITSLEALRVCPQRVIYGSDFPNLPYAWDRELRKIRELGLSDEVLEGLVGGNARRLYGIGLVQ